MSSPLWSITAERVEPMLATPSTSQGGRVPIDITTLTSGWYFQRKYDGVRAQLIYDGHRVRLIGRRGNDLRERFPEIVHHILQLDPREPFSLDGEVVLIDPTYTLAQLLGRVKQTNPAIVRRQASEMPAQFIAFDALHEGGRDLVREDLGMRVQHLELLMDDLHGYGPHLPLSVAESVTEGAALLEQTRRLGQEGVVAKLVSGIYVPGQRSYTWVKFKNTFTLFALAYAPSGEGGQGAALAVLDEGGKVRDVGSVGAGLRESDRAHLAYSWHRGDFPVVLVQCLGISAGGRLRQPVFKGLTAHSMDEASTAQLAELPVST